MRAIGPAAVLALASILPACSLPWPDNETAGRPRPVEVRLADHGIDLVPDGEAGTAGVGGTLIAGDILVTATNRGDEVHELVMVRGTGPETLATTATGTVDESRLDRDEVVGRVSALPAGQSGAAELDLTPGTYTAFCNVVVERSDGTQESHFANGMVTTFVVVDPTIR